MTIDSVTVMRTVAAPGVLLRDGIHRATFLPQVWDDLKDPRQFLRHLKRKAGLPEDHWSETIEIERYTVESLD